MDSKLTAERLRQLAIRSHLNVVAVALANKLARIAWAVLAKQQTYRPAVLTSVSATLLACR